jgi:hypothetical protein
VIEPDPAGVEISAAHSRPLGVAPYLCRGGPSGGVPEPELPGFVVTPAPQGVIEPDPAGVKTTAALDGRPVGVDAHLRRYVPFGAITDPELAVIVVAPTPQGVIQPDPAGVKSTAAHGRPVGV